MQNAQKVISFFKEFSAIPHGSYDEKRISDYLVDFAKMRGLEVYQDELWNVIIKKPSSVQGCTCAPVIIQGHMDMVYVQSDSCTRKYEEGISIIEKNGWLTADGTSLGADDGIAMAYALALLDSDDIPHPDLEVVITVQEEVGLYGAEVLDCSQLKGKYFLNIDTEDEGVFYTSCAGAFRNELRIPTERISQRGMTVLKVALGGMLGGHSGIEIHIGRGNAILLMARLLSNLDWNGIYLSSLTCNGKTNAIANHCEAVLYIIPDKIDSALNYFNRSVAKFNHELGLLDSVELQTIMAEEEELLCYTRESRKRALSAMLLVPNGVLGMSQAIEGLVETSANPGILTQEGDALLISSAVRSSVGSRKTAVAGQLSAIASLTGGTSVCLNDYPQWEYREKSPLRELAKDCYRELFEKESETAAIHAGLECGYFDQKMPGLDIISFGPTQEAVHTPNERVHIKSLENVWHLLQRLLKKLADNSI